MVQILIWVAGVDRVETSGPRADSYLRCRLDAVRKCIETSKSLFAPLRIHPKGYHGLISS